VTAHNYRYRRARERDWRALTRLYSAAFPHFPRREIVYWCRDLLDQTRVLVNGGTIVAAFTGHPRPDRDCYWLEAIAVDNRYRRQGIAADLIIRVHERAEEAGFGAVMLAVRSMNVAAQGLYLMHDYRQVEVDGAWLIMRRGPNERRGAPVAMPDPVAVHRKILWKIVQRSGWLF
jgi:ribosomal protein S18 acetylase RimI-like enzyme